MSWRPDAESRRVKVTVRSDKEVPPSRKVSSLARFRRGRHLGRAAEFQVRQEAFNRAPRLSPFEFLSVAVSFVTGLAVTVILLGAVRAFRARDDLSLDWIPFAWALAILLIQFQIWFSMLTFRNVAEWPFHFFGLLIAQSLTLFVASALILPADSATYPTDLGRYFLRDGRWAVAALAVQFVESVVINVTIGGFPFLQTFHLLHVALLAACVSVLVSRRRVVHVVATLAFLGITTTAMVVTQVSQVYR